MHLRPSDIENEEIPLIEAKNRLADGYMRHSSDLYIHALCVIAIHGLDYDFTLALISLRPFWSIVFFRFIEKLRTLVDKDSPFNSRKIHDPPAFLRSIDILGMAL